MMRGIFDINTTYLEEMGKFIAKSYQTLKCEDIFEIYSQFRRLLKDFRGTSSGFTGLSELLIFRFLYHQLGGSFKIHDVTDELKEFVSESYDNLRIGQDIPIPFKVGKRRVYPDISIYHSENLLSVIEIKVYLTRGTKEVDREIEILQGLKTHYRKLQALLIIFEGLSTKGKIFGELEKQKNMKGWFDFLILKENKELLTKKLHQCLNLERIAAASRNRGI